MRTRSTIADEMGVDFAHPAGAAAMFTPDSIHWRIYKNPVALGVGGVCAVLLEFADPRIRSGVWDHSTYPTDPIGRSQRTGLAAMVGVYGPRDTAERMIGGVTRMHARVAGETPDGVPYRALDPELLDWVAATAAYGFMTAYDRFVRPLSPAERATFWRDGARLAEMYGARNLPSDDGEFADMTASLLPGFEAHPIVEEFLGIVRATDAAGKAPPFVRRAVTRASVSLLPAEVRERLALGPDHDLTRRDRVVVRLLARVAERRFDPASPPALASERLGLPANFLWRSERERARLLADHRAAVAATP